MEKKCLYCAKQVPPDQHGSPYIDDWDYPEGIIICGNGKFNGVNVEDLDMVNGQLNDMTDHIGNDRKFSPRYYKNITEMVHDIAPRENGKPYTAAEIGIWKSLVLDWDNAYLTKDTNRIVSRALGLIRNTPYEYKTIRGVTQSEWNILYYPATLDGEIIDKIEIGYFNKGTQWQIGEVDDDFNEDYETTIYCYGWSEEMQQKEILDNISAYYGGDPTPEQLNMHVYDGEVTVPIYRMFP